MVLLAQLSLAMIRLISPSSMGSFASSFEEEPVAYRLTSYAATRSLLTREKLTDPPDSKVADFPGRNLQIQDMALLACFEPTPFVKAYVNFPDSSADPLCPLCKAEPQTRIQTPPSTNQQNCDVIITQ